MCLHQLVAAPVIAKRKFEASKDCFHLWLNVPDETGWSASELASHPRTKQIGVMSGSPFSNDGSPPNAVHIGFGGLGNSVELEGAFQFVADMLDHPDHLRSSILYS